MAENTNVQKISVFIINKDLPSNRDANVTDYDLYEAINDALDTKTRLQCIRREGEIWRVDLISEEGCQKLKEGFKVNEPFPKGVKMCAKGKEKVLICGLPYSFENIKIKKMLEDLGVNVLTDVRPEEICDPDTKKNSLVANGNRYVFISPLKEDKCLPRNATCAGFTCRLYHSGQETRTFKVKCYDKVCRVCLTCGHDPTSAECCWFNTNQSEDEVTFRKEGNETSKIIYGQFTEEKKKKKNILILDNQLPMSSRCSIEIEGEEFKSAMHAYQTKRTGRKTEIQNSNNKETSHGFEDNSLEFKGWTEHKTHVMKDILWTMFDQIEEAREQLRTIDINTTVFAEATDDCYWGTGLTQEETKQIHPSRWPGENRLGKIVMKIASKINLPKISLFTLNANGLRTPERRQHLFDWLQNNGFDIILLQETGFDSKVPIDSEHFKFYHSFAVSSTNDQKRTRWSGGVSILVKKSLLEAFTFESREIDVNVEGRALLLTINYGEKRFVLINVYAKSGTGHLKERAEFFERLFDFIKTNYSQESNIILGGDFNCKLDSEDSEKSKEILEKSLVEFKLLDLWKHFKGYEEGFTCYKNEKNPSRIDYIFLHNNLESSFLRMCLYKSPSFRGQKRLSDHYGIYVSMNC